MYFSDFPMFLSSNSFFALPSLMRLFPSCTTCLRTDNPTGKNVIKLRVILGGTPECMRSNLDLLINIFMFATIRNVLVGDNNVVKIADFGLARLIKVGSDPAVGWKAT